MEPNMFIGTVLAICFMGCVTFIIAKIIDRRCKHEWEIVDRVAVWHHSYDQMPVKYQYVMRCKHCGTIRHKDV